MTTSVARQPDQRTPVRLSLHGQLISITLLLAFFYAGSSFLAQGLAVPPGFASPIWPAAGIALAAVLLWGPRVAVGVWLGSGAINIYIASNNGADSISLDVIASTVIIALGAAFQALVGAGMIRRFTRRGLAMDTARDIVVLILLGGAAASVISATVGTATLMLYGVVPPSQATFGWFNWWIGDTIGVVVATPLVLALFAVPRQVWRRRLRTVVLPTALSTSATIFLFIAARDMESKRMQASFERECTQLTTHITSDLRNHVTNTQALQSFYAASVHVDAEEFAVFAHRSQVADPHIRALEWVPLVTEAGREQVNELIRESYGGGFTIHSVPGVQTSVGASDGLLMPVTYIHPFANNEEALGLDLLSEPRRASTMLGARDRGEPQVSDAIPLVLGHLGVLIVVPVYEPAGVPPTVLERRQNFKGAVLSVIDVGEMLGDAIDMAGPLGIRVSVQDTSGTIGEKPIFVNATQGDLPEHSDQAWSSFAYRSIIPFAQRQWEFEFTPTAAYTADHRSLYAWMLLVAGLFLTGGLQIFLLTLTGRSSRIEVIVAEKTEALRRSQERFELAVTGASVGIWDVDLQTGETYLSPRCCEIIGGNGVPGVGARVRLHQLLDTHDHRAVRRAFVRHLRDRTQFDVVCQLETGTNPEAWIHIRGQAIWDESGKAVRVAGSISDISIRKQAEEAVVRAYSQLQAFVTYAPAAVAMFDTNMRYVAYSQKWLSDYDLEGQQLSGKSHYDVFPDIPQRWKDIHDRALAGVPESCDEDRLEVVDGSTRWLRWDVRPWPDENGQVGGIVMLTEDITALKQAQQDRAEHDHLVQMTERAHQFVDDVSHEFRTPLTIIKEYTSAIADGLCGDVSEGQQDFLGHISSAVLDLSAMVEDFLDSSKIRAGRLRVDRRQLDVEEIIDRVRGVLDRKAAGRHAGVRYAISPGLPSVFADDEKAGRTLVNLATNAIKFSPQGTNIVVSADSDNHDGVRIAVTDHGPGLAPEDRVQLFERFSQVTTDHQPSVKGFGLGLNIAKQLSWLNLGQIGVESQQGRGSTFWFTLPAYNIESVVDAYFSRIAETDEPESELAMLVSHDRFASPEQLATLERFLCAITWPTDLVWKGADSCVLLGPCSNAQAWRERLVGARQRLQETGHGGIKPLDVEVVGRWPHPADTHRVCEVIREFARGVHHV